jgi:hypothetical protein
MRSNNMYRNSPESKLDQLADKIFVVIVCLLFSTQKADRDLRVPVPSVAIWLGIGNPQRGPVVTVNGGSRRVGGRQNGGSVRHRLYPTQSAHSRVPA